MDITRSNIEYYLALYFNRKLDPVKTAELMLFLAENPDLENLTELPGNLTRQPGNETFADKQFLRKDYHDVETIHEANFDEFCIASAEGLLSDADEKRLNDYITQHPEKEKEARTYRLLKLVADPEIHYAGKSALKKPLPWHRNNRTWIVFTGIAATIALMVLLFKAGHDTPSLPAENYVVQSPVQRDQQGTQQEAQMETQQRTQQNPSPAAGTDPLPETEVRVQTATQLSPVTESHPVTIASNQERSLLSEIDSETTALNPLPSHHEGITLASMDPLHDIQFSTTGPSANLKYASGFGTNRDRNGSYLADLLDDIESRQQEMSLVDFFRELDPWKTALYAVKGFNALTESRIVLDKTTDNQGKMNGLIIDTESYTLLAKDSE